MAHQDGGKRLGQLAHEPLLIQQQLHISHIQIAVHHSGVRPITVNSIR